MFSIQTLDAAVYRTLSDDELEAFTAKLLSQHQRPNTYTLTKAVAEKLVEEQRGTIPCCVLRPTIVGGSYQEPVPVCVYNSYIPAERILCEVAPCGPQ